MLHRITRSLTRSIPKSRILYACYSSKTNQENLKVIADICVIPCGVGLSVSKYVAECQKVFQKHPIKYNLHAYGTNLEGKFDDVMAAVKECHQVLHEMGVQRIHTNLKLGTRIDKNQTLEDKIESVKNKL